jgi:hypothetical protein
MWLKLRRLKKLRRATMQALSFVVAAAVLSFQAPTQQPKAVSETDFRDEE